MKIAAWNIERLKHKRDIDKIILACDNINADIIVLTETDMQVKLGYKYYFHTPLLSEIPLIFLKALSKQLKMQDLMKYICLNTLISLLSLKKFTNL